MDLLQKLRLFSTGIFRGCGRSKCATGMEIGISFIEGADFQLVISFQLSISALSQLMKKMPLYRKEISKVRGLL